ncbi:YciI family protein [Aneurinibacillus tyrosinisolvens]|uniref:YciI family protein n=1 Tax=Aneurinibacillus tyrosinisolvens TaxID=1443435 RepID=UPI00063EE683|nr:YciI family protein [Aneurinibacillus tyrosinisolvens]
MFIVLLKYLKPLDQVETFINEHREFLGKYYKESKFLASGPQVPREGGVIIVNADSREEVQMIIEEDPFKREEIAHYNIIEFTPTMHDERISHILQQAR